MNDKEMIDCKICSHKEVCHYHECINDCEEWAKEYQCEYYQPKIPENAVVLTGTETTENLIDLLVDFDEMGFCPTTLTPNPDAYAVEWKQKLVYAIGQARKETAREIWQIIKDEDLMFGNNRYRLRLLLKEKYGVDLRE